MKNLLPILFFVPSLLFASGDFEEKTFPVVGDTPSVAMAGLNPVHTGAGNLNRKITDLMTFGESPVIFTRHYRSRATRHNAPYWVGLSIAMLLLIVAINSILWVPEGWVGIRSRLGKVSDKAMASGLHLKIPFAEHIHYMSTRMLYNEVNVSALSRDGIVIKITAAQQYQINPKSSPQNLAKHR